MGTPNEFSCIEGGAGLLPNRPYLALYPHYGMLLGVDDFVTEQAYHRGKMRLHNAWLHGWGAVWGLGVEAVLERGEIEVAPGLAFDGWGRDLHNDQAQCVNVGRWFVAHRDDAGFVFTEGAGAVGFDGHVVIRHRACLARPVPALLDTCSNSAGTAYSRVQETVEILLRPGRAPAPAVRHHLLRLLAGLDLAREDDDGNVLPDDQAVLDARALVAAAPPADRVATAAEAMHRIGVLDGIAGRPADDPDGAEASLFPAEGPAELALADVLDIGLQEQADGTYRLTQATVDINVRSVLLPTTTLQGLAGALLSTLLA